MTDAAMQNSANALMRGLTTDVNLKFPEIKLDDDLFKFPGDKNSLLYKEVKPLTNEQLTSRKVDGTGTFDAIMSGVNAHLGLQFDKGRITADEYAKAYIALTEAAMGNAVQFLVQRDVTYWQAQAAQLASITARIQLEAEKYRLAMAEVDALNAKSNYATSKVKLATASVEHGTLKYRLENILPKENIALAKQNEGLQIENDTKTFNLDVILETQNKGLLLDNDIKRFNLQDILPIDADTKQYSLQYLMPAQLLLLKEQYEVQRAQTMDYRSDSQTVVGTLGKQKDLYSQQIESYKRNAEFNAAKIFSDSWITQKTLDEGLIPPDSFTNASVQSVMTNLRTKNGI